MKVHLLRDKKGKAIASINETVEDPNLVPLDVDSDDGGKIQELEIKRRDLFDIERFYDKVLKK